jgi:hypothetical protein
VVGDCAYSVVVGPFSEQEYRLYLDHLGAVVNNLHPGVVVLDCLFQIPRPTPLQRQAIGEVVNQARTPELVAGHAVVTSSAAGRGALTAINWVVRKPFPEKVFGKPGDALAWLHERNPRVSPEAVMQELHTRVPGFETLAW